VSGAGRGVPPAVGEGPVEGDRVPLVVDAPAHGGHCIARLGGQIVFVRHALPGERVVAEITEVHGGYLRADAVDILDPSPDRVVPPCPFAGPGRCGGCDLQHAAPDAQRAWKTAVVHEQLTRLGGLTSEEVDALGVRVVALPGDLLGWRTRVRYAVDAAGRPGLLKHRSHEVVPIDRCRIAHPAIQALPILTRRWPDTDAVETVATSTGDVAFAPVDEGRPGPRSWTLHPGSPPEPGGSPAGPLEPARPPSSRVADTAAGEEVAGGSGDAYRAAGARRADPVAAGEDVVLGERVGGRAWTIRPETFWQVHPAAPETLVRAVLDLADPRPGERAWDLYGGAGLFAAALAERVGQAGRVTLVESAPDAVAAARDNLADLTCVEVVSAKVETALARRRVAGPVDVVVLDPPRTGAGARVVEALTRSGARAVAYVACDPAAFARDVKTFRAAGWHLTALRAYDCFPMTHHIECVGLLTP